MLKSILEKIKLLLFYQSTERFLDDLENTLNYKKWYCGHYHTEKIVDKIEFMFESVKEFDK